MKSKKYLKLLKINHAHLYFVDENYVYTNHNPIGKIYYYGYIFNVY